MPSLLPELFLALALIVGLFTKDAFWVLFFLGSAMLLSALMLKRLSFKGLFITLAYVLFAFKLGHYRGDFYPLLLGLFCAFSLGLFFHKYPGFEAINLLGKVQLEQTSKSFQLHMHLDKPLIGLIFLLFFFPLQTEALDLEQVATLLCLYVGAFILVLLLPAVVIRYVRFSFKVPSVTWKFALRNFLFTCVVEEALFRGLIQKEVSTFAPLPVALVLASVMFGLVHYDGGKKYVALATIAGFGYGLIYYQTGHFLAPVLLHFIVNMIHFICFSYPTLGHGEMAKA